jgi:hypothetical protein
MNLTTQRSKRLALFTYFSILTIGICMCFASRAAAETDPAARSRLQTTFSKLTIDNAAPFSESVSTNIPPEAQPMFGGSTKVSCKAGQSPSQCMPMGVFDYALGVGQLTPDTAATAAGKTVDPNAPMSVATPWLGDIKTSDALAANPDLQAILPSSGAVASDGTLNPAIADRPFGNVVDLTKVPVRAVPSVRTTPFGRYQGFQALTANKIPNLGSIPFTKMPGFTIPAGASMLRLDLVRNRERNVQHKVMSGSELQPNAPCKTNCDYIETTPLVGLPFLKGAKIISGDSQQVEGGKGMLRWVNGGKEPTGVSFNAFKLVVRQVKARPGSAVVNINFRSCFSFFGLHCTPFFIGFPLWQMNERYNTIPIVTTDGVSS